MQPGFFVLALYAGWIYAQYSLVLMVCGFPKLCSSLTSPALRCISIEELSLSRRLGRALCTLACGRSYLCSSIPESFVFQQVSNCLSSNRQLYYATPFKVVVAFHSSTPLHAAATTLRRSICWVLTWSTFADCRAVCYGSVSGLLHHHGHCRVLWLNHGGFRHNGSSARNDWTTNSSISRRVTCRAENQFLLLSTCLRRLCHYAIRQLSSRCRCNSCLWHSSAQKRHNLVYFRRSCDIGFFDLATDPCPVEVEESANGA